MNNQVAAALKELAEQFKKAWPDHTGKYDFLIGAGHNIAKELATPTPNPDAGEGVEVVGYQWLDTAHYRRAIPRYVDHAGVALWHELMTVAQHNRIVSVLQASAMVLPDGYALIPIESLAKFPEINPANYGDDEVMALNNWAIDLVLSASPSAKGGE